MVPATLGHDVIALRYHIEPASSLHATSVKLPQLPVYTCISVSKLDAAKSVLAVMVQPVPVTLYHKFRVWSPQPDAPGMLSVLAPALFWVGLV